MGIVMTSITTAIGFISLLTSQVYPIKYFGIFTAFGVLAAMLFSLTLIPAGIMIFGLPKVKKAKTKQTNDTPEFSYKFASWIVRRKSISLIATAVIIVLSIIGLQKIWINSSFLDKFEKDSDIVLTDKFINEHFGGTTTLNLILDAGEENIDVFKEPEVLKLVDKMQKTVVHELELVGNSFSLTDYVNRMNKVMNADKEEFNTIPDSKDMIAQYLLLYEMSGDPENLNKVVDYDYSKLNVNFQLKSDNSKAINSALAEISSFEDDFKEHGVMINYAGSGYKGLVFTDLILEGQIKSLILSLIIVIILLAIMFKNFKLGLIGAIPIVVTALISFGVMGFLDIPLSTTTALLSSIAIGIGIDYAVHFIEQYKINAINTGNKQLTAQKTMAHSGRAISFNAIVVIAGFLVLLFSVFPPNRELGALVSLNMFTSFLGTLTIMLVLLNKSNIYFKN
jgi:predicted RND superfamily exporter protein